MKTAAIGAAALAVASAGVWGASVLLHAGSSKCDAPATVETVKALALSKIKKDALRNLTQDQTILMVALDRPASLILSGFRDRGKIGAGTICAALLTISLDVDKQYGPVELSTEYTVEPTTDGNVMVSARFRPN
jgi:hypothetical protein